MEIFPERVQKLWNEWELRVMVLLSLSLQIILIYFGKWRKHTANNWLRIIIWSAYLSADWVATVSLGILANSQGDSSNNHSQDPNDVLVAFWAPFLLLHLGGPDTITAYSLEDNELWKRHLLGLLVQVGVAFYVFLRSWTGNRLSFLAITMFVPGIIKYGERTWVLRSASRERFRDSMLTPPNPGPNYAQIMDEYSTKKDEGRDVRIKLVSESREMISSGNGSSIIRFAMPEKSEFRVELPNFDMGDRNDMIPDARNLRVAYYLFQRFKRLFAEVILSSSDLRQSLRFFEDESLKEDGFKVVEMELGLMYDVFYTKASIVYSRAGCILRCISLSSTISLFVAFLMIEKHGYLNIDIIITHILLVGAIVLEIYALILAT